MPQSDKIMKQKKSKMEIKTPTYYRQEFRGPLAYLYDFSFKLITLGRDKKLRAIFLMHIPKKNRNILDMATGTGAVACIIKKYIPNASVIGIDLSNTMLSIAKAKAQRQNYEMSFLLENIERTNFKNSQFDAITLSFGLHELPLEHRKNIFKEAHRLLKKGGRFIIMDFNNPRNILLRWLLYFHIFLAEKYAKSLLEQDLEKEMQKIKYQTFKKIHYGGLVQVVIGKK